MTALEQLWATEFLAVLIVGGAVWVIIAVIAAASHPTTAHGRSSGARCCSWVRSASYWR